MSVAALSKRTGPWPRRRTDLDISWTLSSAGSALLAGKGCPTLPPNDEPCSKSAASLKTFFHSFGTKSTLQTLERNIFGTIMRDPGVDSRDAPASGLDTGAASGIDCPCCISMFGGPVAPKTSGFQSTLKVAILAALVLLLVLVPVAESKWLPSTSDHKEKWPCRNFRDDFNDPSTLIPVEDWDGDASTGPNFLSEYRPHTANVKDGVLILELFKGDQLNGYNRSEGMQTVVSWTRWWKTGKMCARMMTSRGNGTVTAVVAMSYNGSAAIDDEVDLEWTGRDQGIYLQTNWFGHERPVYGHGITDHRIGSDSSVNFHTYCFERTTEAISWEIDGAVVRRNTFAEWGDRGLPWRESKLVFNIWDGGQGDNGTAYWAGGPTDWRDPKNPNYRVIIDWFQVWCYDQGPEPTNGTWATKTKTSTASRKSSMASTTATRTTTNNLPGWMQSALPTSRTLLGGFPTVVPLTPRPKTTTTDHLPEATQPPAFETPVVENPRNTLTVISPTSSTTAPPNDPDASGGRTSDAGRLAQVAGLAAISLFTGLLILV